VPHASEVVVRPCFRQFYLRRGRAEWRSDEISPAGYERGLEEVDGFVYVGTSMYGSPTRLAITVHASDPGEPPIASIRVPTGRLHARVGWHGTDAAKLHPDNDIGGDELSPEHLTLDVWPSQ